MILKTILFATILMLISSICIQGQTCDCGKDIAFLTEAYQKDYSGMQDFIKTHPKYSIFIDNLSKKAKNIKDIKECDKIIQKLIDFLDNGHVVYGMTKENPLYKATHRNNVESSSSPTIKFLDNSTALFQITTCDLAYKNTLDSIVGANKLKLDTTKHFIIDLRGNGGGGDAMFDTLIPYLYTNPILIHSAALWASENNIKMFSNLLTYKDVPEEAKTNIRKIVANCTGKTNQFVPLSDNKTDTINYEKVLVFPQKVSLLIDKECKSATEQFLLLAMQSSKTKIYGYENSGGALDYANLNFIVTPSGYWYASVPTTRTMRLPQNPVDPMGIKPDVLVDKKNKDIIKWLMNE